MKLLTTELFTLLRITKTVFSFLASKLYSTTAYADNVTALL